MRIHILLFLAFAIIPYRTRYESDFKKMCLDIRSKERPFINSLLAAVPLVEAATENNKVLRVKLGTEKRIVKVLYPKESGRGSIKANEIRTLKSLRQYWFVNTLDDKDTDFCYYDKNKTYIVMKAFDSSLGNIHNRYDLDEIYWSPSWRLFAILAVGNAMVRLHNLSYLHRDIKPQNVFVKDVFDIVLGDFDATIHLPPEKGEAIVNGYKNGDIAGTSVYIAPEALGSRIYSVKSDAFSFGVFIFNLLTNETFSPAHTVYGNLFELINNYEDCDETYDTGTPTDLYCNYFKQLVKELISEDPVSRPHGYALIKKLYEIVAKAYTGIKETSRELKQALAELRADENSDIFQLNNTKNHLDMIDPRDFESRLTAYIDGIDSSQQQEILRIDNLVFMEELQEPCEPINRLKSNFAGIDYISALNSKIKRDKKGNSSCLIFI